MKERVNPVFSNFTYLFEEKTGSNFVVATLQYFNTQLTFTCSKSAIETLEKVVNYVQC